MSNILDSIYQDLQEIKKAIAEMPRPETPTPAEIIDTAELCRRLDISDNTATKWRQRKKIPFIKLDGVIRYNWPAVVASLETKSK